MRRRHLALGIAALGIGGLMVWMAIDRQAPAPAPRRVASPVVLATTQVAAPPAPVAAVVASVDTAGIPARTEPWQPVARIPEQRPASGGLPWHLDTASYDDGAFDPDKRPFAEWQFSFAQTGAVPEGWMTDNVVLMGGELALAPTAPADELGIRKGRLETTAIEMEMDYNAVVPMWKESLPPGTKIDVAISVSADGVKWGDWHQCVPDAEAASDMQPFYPDGRPNPNMGYSLAAPMYGDRRLYRYARLRATLYSASEDSPRLSSLRTGLLDVTHGKGQLAAMTPGEESYPNVGDIY